MRVLSNDQTKHNLIQSYDRNVQYTAMCDFIWAVDFAWADYTLHKKWSFSLRIYSVNLNISARSADLVTFTEEILNWKLHFLYI